MEDSRKGFFNKDHHKIIDDLFDLNGIAEMASDLAIKLGDDKGLELLKPRLVAKYGEGVLDDIYEVVDMIMLPLGEIAKNMQEKK